MNISNSSCRRWMWPLIAATTALPGCGGDEKKEDVLEYSVGGVVNGFAGSGLVLQLNGAGDLAPSGNGNFVFPTAVESSRSYVVSVKSQPSRPGQRCTVTNGSGQIGTQDVTNVAVDCMTPIVLLAGKLGGAGSIDGYGTEARLNGPAGVAIDATGNVYIADGLNHTIRRLAPTGEVTTLAGLAGVSGSADGTGSTARFKNPAGLAVDGAGNLYVADRGNASIRKIAPTGVVTTLAGRAGDPGSTDGPAADARFFIPGGVAVDAAGTVYVADSGNWTIRKISPAGVVSTWAGTRGLHGLVDGPVATALFYDVAGMAFDSNGNLFVADAQNGAVRKITPNGIVSTFGDFPDVAPCSRPVPRYYCLPMGLAIDRNDNVFVSSAASHLIHRISTSGVVTPLAGNGEPGSTDATGLDARFSVPTALAIDRNDNLYVADERSDLLRKVTPAGAVTTLVGTPPNDGTADGTGESARFSFPADLVGDNVGNLYVTEANSHVIRRITSGGVVTTLAGTSGNAGNADGIGSAARFSSPVGIVIDDADDLYVSDEAYGSIRKVTTAGVVTTLLSRNSFWGGGLARDSAGNFYVIVLTENQVFRVTPAGTITSFAGRASAGSADGFGSAAEFNFPRDVAADTAGNLYVADSGNHTIRRITPDGNVTTFAGLAGSRGFADGPGTTARFNLPRSVTVDGAGNLYVSDLANHAIRRITPAGIVSTIAGDPTRVGIAIGDVPGSLSAPAGIWVLPGPGTRLAVTDTVENVVLLITLP